MITEDSFEKDWILNFRKAKGYEKIHPELLEKMIYALYLVELLVQFKLSFIFKGGTCLTILLPEVKRFSIDVDILTELEPSSIDEILLKIIGSSRFTRFEKDLGRKAASNIPKAHYLLYYISQIDNHENKILLDVVFDKNNPYSEIIYVDLKNKFLSLDNKVSLKIPVPSINSITGDKLTAFAPNTIGISYNSRKELQIIKQLFDLGHLYSSIDNLAHVYKTFEEITKAQCRYLQKSYQVVDVLNDTIDTAYIIAMQEKNRGESLKKFRELKTGIQSFKSFLPDAKYTIFDAIESSAKAALLAVKLKLSDFSPLPILNLQEFVHEDFLINSGRYMPVYKMIKSMPNCPIFYWFYINDMAG